MKKFQVFATMVNINGRKSSGQEDYGGYNHWRALGTGGAVD